jgi:protein SCO1/2
MHAESTYHAGAGKIPDKKLQCLLPNVLKNAYFSQWQLPIFLLSSDREKQPYQRRGTTMPLSYFAFGKVTRHVLLIVFLLGLVLLSACGTTNTGTPPPTTSTSWTPSQAELGNVPSPNFQLADQQDKAIHLSLFQGQPVVISFLYTHCPDMCPLAAEKFHQTVVNLGTQARHVTILAVSVDPEHDTQASAQQFSTAHQLDQFANWHFLLGSRQQLIPVWKSYGIYTDAQSGPTAQGQAITHMGIVYVLDKAGRERWMLPVDFTPTQLTDDLKTLLSE